MCLNGVSTDNSRANLIFLPPQSLALEKHSRTQRESKYLSFSMQCQWLYWGTVESKITHWPLNNLFTSAVMKGRVFVFGAKCDRAVRPRSTGVVPFPAKHLSSEQARLQRSQQGYIYITFWWRKKGGRCPGCSSNPDSPNVLQMRQNVDTMVHWNHRNAAVIGNSSAGLLCGASTEWGQSKSISLAAWTLKGESNTARSGSCAFKVLTKNSTQHKHT